MFCTSLQYLQLRLPGRLYRTTLAVVGGGATCGTLSSSSTFVSLPPSFGRTLGGFFHDGGSMGFSSSGSSTSLCMQRRLLEYWGIGVTGRTQAYAQGDMFPRLDNMKNCVSKSSSTAAALTGNPNLMEYNEGNIFSVKDYSAAERDHYQPLRGISTHRVDPLPAGYASTVFELFQRLLNDESDAAAGAGGPAIPMPPRQNPDIPQRGLSLRVLWWNTLLTDFPSLKTPVSPVAFRQEWENFFLNAFQVADDAVAVQELGRPFLKKQMEEHFIQYAMIWRFAERLGDAMGMMTSRAQHKSVVTPQEHKMAKVVIERVIKLMLDTLASEPWAHQETTSPLHVEVSQFRAWHEAGNW